MKFGYIRVSCADKQEYLRQENILKDYNIDKLFEEKISGTKKAITRPEFEIMLEEIKEGDEIYFESMSRMARSMQDLIETTNLLTEKKKVVVIFLKENIRVGGAGLDAMTKLVFHIMGAFAQFERDLTSIRTVETIRAKRASDPNFKIGRPTTITSDTIALIHSLREQGLSYDKISEETGVSKGSISRILNKGEK